MNWQRVTPALPRLAWLLAALLLLLAGWQLWRLAQFVRQTRAEALAAQRELATAPRLDAAQAWQRLLAANLFGVAAQGAAPRSTLPLKLEGVWADRDGHGYAMIAAENAPARVYARGEGMPYGATLREIYADHVLIATAAGLQSLDLPRPAAAGSSAAPPGELAINQAPPAALVPPPDAQEQAAEETAAGPKPMIWPPGRGPLQVGQAVVGSPVLREGKLAGFMLRPGRDNAAYARMGLRPGDMLVGVDGQPLGDAAETGAALMHALQSGSARVEIERDGRMMSVELKPQQ